MSRGRIVVIVSQSYSRVCAILKLFCLFWSLSCAAFTVFRPYSSVGDHTQKGHQYTFQSDFLLLSRAVMCNYFHVRSHFTLLLSFCYELFFILLHYPYSFHIILYCVTWCEVTVTEIGAFQKCMLFDGECEQTNKMTVNDSSCFYPPPPSLFYTRF